MLFVSLALLVVLGVVTSQYVSARSSVSSLRGELAEERAARAAADAAAVGADAAADAARKERDDALERASRAKRDAAEVARRMQEEAEARVAAEAEQASSQLERERLEDQLAAAEAASAAGDDGRIAELWSLALAGVRRTWEISVCPSPGMPCPLDGSESILHDAIEIEVDAAREEAGAAIELVWTGDSEVPPATSLRALSIAQELIGRLSKVAEQATIDVTVDDAGSVVLVVTGQDDAGADIVPTDVAPDHLDGAGRYVLGRR